MALDKTEERYLIYGGAGLALAVIAFSLLHSSNNSNGAGTVPQPSSQLLAFLQHGQDTATAAAQAKSNLAAQTLLQYQNQKNAFDLGISNITAQRDQNILNAKTAEDIATVQANAASSVAQLGMITSQNIATTQSNAATAVAQAAANAQTASAKAAADAQKAAAQAQAGAQTSNGIWGAIGSIFSHFIP